MSNVTWAGRQEYSLMHSAAGTTRGAEAGFLFCIMLLLLSVFVQKVAIPGSDGRLPVSTLGFAGLSAIGLFTGHLRVSTTSLAFFLIFVLVIIVSFIMSQSPELSVLSLALMISVQYPLALRLAPNTVSYARLLDFTNTTLILVAVFGIAQFAAQFVIGSNIAYFLDVYSPQSLFLEDYNRLNPLEYGSPYYKSNGFFLAEPSFFCQYMAIGLIIELMSRRRLPRLLIYAVAIVCSFSGTGLMMLALFLPFYILKRGGVLLLILAIGTGVALVAGASAIGLDFFVERATEFTRPGTSGHARFVSPFIYIGDVILGDPRAFIFGRGPGTITEYFDLFPYEPFNPTWAKIVYEYGLLGVLAYAAFFLSVVRTVQPRYLKAPLVILYFVLGGYSQNAFIVSLLAVFLSWTARQYDVARNPALERPLQTLA